MRNLLIITSLVFWLTGGLAFTGSAQVQPLAPGDAFSFQKPAAEHHTKVRLLLSADTARPGDTVMAGIQMKMTNGWHTYWKNPGDAGQATTIAWQFPAGVTNGDIQWPIPKKLPPIEVTTYAYEDEVVLLVPITLASNLPPGPLNLSAKVSWLECQDVCIPANQDVTATLNIGAETKSSANAATIDAWQKRTPSAADAAGFSSTAWWEKPADGDTRPLIIDRRLMIAAAATVELTNADFFPSASDDYEIQPVTDKINVGYTEIRLRKQVKKLSSDWPKEISGVMVMTDFRGGQTGVELKLPVADQPPAGEVTGSTSAPQSLWRMLIFAFIGGLILNIMPCVLPVIALKILGFVSEAKSSPGRVRALGGVYTVGVLASFLVLAGVVIGVKSAGHQAGWGMQFASPTFLVCLTTLMTLVALNLFGVFEVMIGGRALDKAGELTSRGGIAGAFFNGVLATALATPCTAPILGYALGFAFAQSAPVIISIFLTVGLGLSFPYLLLSWNPAWLNFLPKPGVWMEKFKIAIGFPVLGTVIWLYTLVSGVLNKDQWLWFGLFLLVLALAAWIWGEFVQKNSKRRGLAALISLLLAVGFGAYAYFLPPDQIDWQPWSPDAIAKARADSRPILVDFTADWCLTCKANKKFSIEIPSVRKKLHDINAVALVGDYTHTPDSITTELNRYNRAGVPLVLVYPKAGGTDPIVLPEVLTPGIVLDALSRASQ